MHNSLYSLYAFHKTQGVIHIPQHLLIHNQLVLVYVAVVYITKWIISLAHAFQKCYMRGKFIKKYCPPPTHRSPLT